MRKFASGVALTAMAVALAAPTGSWAQEAAASAAAAAGISTGPNPEYGLAVEGWMLYPSFFAGMIYTDNVYNTAYNRRSGAGLQLRPSVEAVRDIGIHKTQLYGHGDFQIYPGREQSYQYWPYPAVLAKATKIAGDVGFSHTYQPLPDLRFTLVGDFTRSSGGLFGGSYAGVGKFTIPNVAGVTGPGTYSNQVTGSVTVEKKFTERFVVGVSANVAHIAYDAQPSAYWFSAVTGAGFNTSSGRATSYGASLRGTYWLTPIIYGFVEPSLDLRRYPNSWNDTNGYRVVGGVGSDLISLFKGEIYGGYQAQSSDKGLFRTTSAPAFGGRLFYYPTRDLTIAATLDETFSAPQVQASTFVAGVPIFNAPSAPTRNTMGRLRADWAILEYWSTYAFGGYGVAKTDAYWGWFGGYTPSRSTAVWQAGVGTSYTFWRNVALTLDYTFSKSTPSYVWSSAWWQSASVVSNTVSAGLTYKY